MRFHTFGDKKSPVMVLIHGVLTPWQMWEAQIEHFQSQYYMIVPALDGHTEEERSDYLSVDDEADRITDYLIENGISEIFAICGLSMGGVIANRIFEKGKICIKNLILDGAPLYPINPILTEFMNGQYQKILVLSKKRDPKTLENFQKDFLPEKYLENYLRFIDFLTADSLANMVHSVCNSSITPCENINGTRMLFLHGTLGNEMISKKAAILMKKNYPNLEIKIFQGYRHVELATFDPQNWIQTVQKFLEE